MKQSANNIGELLRGNETVTLLRRLGCDERYLDGRASDFEWFSEWERVYPLALGTGLAALYREALRILSMEEPSESITREESCRRWELANERLASIPLNEAEEEKTVDLSGALSDWLRESDPHGRTVSAFAERLMEEIGEGAVTRLWWNVGSASFVRPDPYHADLALRSLSEGTGGEEEILLALSQCVIYLLLKDDARSRISLHLYSEDSYETAGQLFDYLSAKKIPVCPLCLGVLLRDDPTRWISICDRSGAVPQWILRPEDFGAGFEERLARTIATYPAGGMKVGRSLAEPPLSVLMRRLLRRTAEKLLTASDSIVSSRSALQNWQ